MQTANANADANGQLEQPDRVSLPVINITHPPATTSRRMIKAATEYGFFYVDTRGSGFTPNVVERQFDLVNPQLPSHA